MAERSPTTDCASPSWRKILLLALLLAGGAPAHPLLAEETQTQFWPEVDLFYRLDARWRLFGLLAAKRGEEGDRQQLQAGVHLELSMVPILHGELTRKADIERYRYLRFRAGYRLLQSLKDAETTEHRGITEATLRARFFGNVLGLYRVRGEFRWIEGVFSFRFRNRIRAERRIEVGEFAISPFCSFEISYDTRFDCWNRTLWTLGLETELSDTIILEAYFAHQHDTRSQPVLLNAIGLTLKAYL